MGMLPMEYNQSPEFKEVEYKYSGASTQIPVNGGGGYSLGTSESVTGYRLVGILSYNTGDNDLLCRGISASQIYLVNKGSSAYTIDSTHPQYLSVKMLYQKI